MSLRYKEFGVEERKGKKLTNSMDMGKTKKYNLFLTNQNTFFQDECLLSMHHALYLLQRFQGDIDPNLKELSGRINSKFKYKTYHSE